MLDVALWYPGSLTSQTKWPLGVCPTLSGIETHPGKHFTNDRTAAVMLLKARRLLSGGWQEMLAKSFMLCILNKEVLL